MPTPEAVLLKTQIENFEKPIVARLKELKILLRRSCERYDQLEKQGHVYFVEHNHTLNHELIEAQKVESKTHREIVGKINYLEKTLSMCRPLRFYLRCFNLDGREE